MLFSNAEKGGDMFLELYFEDKYRISEKRHIKYLFYSVRSIIDAISTVTEAFPPLYK